MADQFTITVDGKEIKADPKKLLIDVLRENGTDVPHYCYHEKLSVAGSCRLCMVEIEGAPKPMISCNTGLRDGMIVHTKTEKVKKAREDVLEFLLLNHPVDCPVCDKAGECKLQDYSFEHGKSASRFDEPKRVPPFKDLGPHIMIATTRCVMCTRCVRFMDEIAGDEQLTVLQRGSHAEICAPANIELDHPLAGNVIDICPVGALLDKDFIHRTRVWHLTKTPSICGECSTGCNVKVENYKNEIFRILPRDNQEVNEEWICDTGRASYKKYNDIERINNFSVKSEGLNRDVELSEAMKIASDGFKSTGSTAVILSSSSSNEDAYAAKEFAKKCFKSDNVAAYIAKPKEDQTFKAGFVIKGDKSPNAAGLKMVLNTDFNTLIKDIEDHKIKSAYVVKNDLSDLPTEVIDTLKKLKFLVVESIVESELTKIADVVLPGQTNFERTGTFVNYQNRIQWNQKAIDGPAKSTWEYVNEFGSRMKQNFGWNSSSDVFLQMAKSYKELEGLSHFRIGPLGKVLNGNNK